MTRDRWIQSASTVKAVEHRVPAHIAWQQSSGPANCTSSDVGIRSENTVARVECWCDGLIRGQDRGAWLWLIKDAL